MSAGLLLGVDGGNTKTVALAARPDGTIVGAGRALGCADIHATSLDAAVAVLAAAVDDALRSAGGSVGASAFSLAGADWPEDVAELRAALAGRWPGAAVVNDGIGALRAAVPAGPGVVVVCGTGAATASRGSDGQLWHSSFWQEPQGAHEMGVRALLAVVRAELGIAPPTALSAAVTAALGEPDVEGVLHRWTARDRSRRLAPASLAATLLDVAETGDETAAAIVREHGSALGRTALAAARRVGIADQPFPLALAGGVFRHPGSLLHDALTEAVAAGAPNCVPVRPSLEPAAGALLLAFDAAGRVVDDAVMARLRASLPALALFDTRPGERSAIDA